jgi:hypothetical protein
MTAPMRPEVGEAFGAWLNALQFKDEGYLDGEVVDSYGIGYVSDPYG